MSLLLWRKMVAVHYFVWPLGLQLWSVRQAVSLKFKFWQFFKILYPAIWKCFVYLMFYALYGLVLFRKGDFRFVRYL